ncbi:DNA-directed DNA polymerase alpha subunit pol12 [Emydomyces testavorans]|uniref:DNA polymerase alpha subunit B n=1 Tax=Emydomyces testavorans TaxID=2070801 RepID=A0AAF0DLW3_9EURO|nr:DNA-directed DNA polymerase alpha subunit pol12 [Emydomyces testavorans]
MADFADELNEHFAGGNPDGLPPDILAELRSIMNLHALSVQELFYKWESYCIKMGAEEMKLNLETARALKRDIQDTLERESRGKMHLKLSEKRNAITATPRAVGNNQDVFDMLGDLVPNTPANGKSVKRKAGFDTGKLSSPMNTRTPMKPSGRQNSGQILETLNSDLSTAKPPMAPYSESRIKLTANTDIKKFVYKPMAMKLSEASEVLDDRIDEFAAIYQKEYGQDETPFGNAANQSTRTIIAVGRIASDSLEGRLNTASLVLEMSRRTGAGFRVPLKTDSIPSVQFFPGQIVAVKGINASGEYFSVSEVLPPPLLPPPVSAPAVINSTNQQLCGTEPLNILITSGPYTTDDNLEFEPLNALCVKAAEQSADILILMGPFLDIEHPLLANGDFELPELNGVDPDTATLSTLFKYCISRPLHQLAMAVPSIIIVLIPSVRDAVSKHVSWPQEMLLKRELGLPKQVRMVPNPVTISLNESVFGLCSYDVLYELRQEEVLGGTTEENILTRLPRYLIEQRHFSPVFPPSARENLPRSGTDDGTATGAVLDLRYLKLGEWWNVRPDVMVTPSVLAPFVRVVEGVLIINPGTLSKRKGPGTYAQIAMHPRTLTDQEQSAKHVSHKVFERARVDVIKI